MKDTQLHFHQSLVFILKKQEAKDTFKCISEFLISYLH